MSGKQTTNPSINQSIEHSKTPHIISQGSKTLAHKSEVYAGTSATQTPYLLYTIYIHCCPIRMPRNNFKRTSGVQVSNAVLPFL